MYRCGWGRQKERRPISSCSLQRMTREQRPLSLLKLPTVFQSWSDLKSAKRRFSTGNLSVQPPPKTATKNQKYPISYDQKLRFFLLAPMIMHVPLDKSNEGSARLGSIGNSIIFYLNTNLFRVGATL